MPASNELSRSSPPFVSVLIPVKNGEGKLEHCLRALREQSYPSDSFEIIVADGASTDRTAEIARTAGARVVENPKQNLPAGRNVALAAARGELVAYLDDDCLPARDWLARGVAALETGGFSALGGPLPMPADSPAFARAVDWVFRAAARGAGAVQSGAARTALAEDIPGGNSLYRRAALEDVGSYDEALWAEDVDLHLRLRRAGFTLGFCPEFVATHPRQAQPRRFFAQMRRYAIGRAQIFRKHRQGVKLAHVAIAAVGTLSCAGAVLAPGSLVVVGAGAGTLLCVAGLLAGEPASTALLIGPAFAIFVAGWTVGAWSELLVPLRSTTGW